MIKDGWDLMIFRGKRSLSDSHFTVVFALESAFFKADQDFIASTIQHNQGKVFWLPFESRLCPSVYDSGDKLGHRNQGLLSTPYEFPYQGYCRQI